MPDTNRKTGIDVIGDVPWGTHLCQFYQDKRDLIDILVPYFKAGLENNESNINLKYLSRGGDGTYHLYRTENSRRQEYLE